jgi:hypothetical protein
VDRNILYLTLSLAALWFILDDFYGEKRISTMIDQLVNGSGGTKVDSQLTPLPPTAGDPAPIPPNLAAYKPPQTPPSVPAAKKPSTAFLGKPGVII